MTGDESDADETYLNVNLSTTIDLPCDSSSIDRFFAAITREHPDLSKRSIGAGGEILLECDSTTGNQTWISVEPRRWSCGQTNPASTPHAHLRNETLLDEAARLLPIRETDCEALDLIYGFDFRYAGNHDELVARALGLGPSLSSLMDIPGSRVIDFQPSLTLAMDRECLVQCRLSVETRTNAAQVRTGQYPDESLSVYFAVREHLVTGRSGSLVETLRRLQTLGESHVSERILPRIIRPIAQAIASA